MELAEFRKLLHENKDTGYNCPVSRTLEILSGKWTPRILYELQKQDTIRFGELKRRMPEITNTMISSSLKQLEEYGIVVRKQFNEIPPHVEYSLSEAGNAMLPIFFEMSKWGETYLKKD